MSMAENNTYRVETDGFYGELFTPAEDKFPGKLSNRTVVRPGQCAIPNGFVAARFSWWTT